MKQVIIAVIIIAIVVLAVTNVDKIEQMLHPGQTKSMGKWIDNSEIEKYNFGGSAAKELEAEMKGDTYCKKCDKFNPGKVRICTYCGQYI